VRGLTKRYGPLTAVDHIDLDLARGELFALLGPNGAGKSTTVEILEGFRARTQGEVRVLGVDPARADRRWRARIGIVLQESGEIPPMTVREQIAHFAGLYPNPRPVGEVLELVGLADKADARIRTLSGGLKRRLDVALGIVGRPDLLFLDEPTTGFDPQARREAWTMIEGLREGGTTIVLTTHYLEEAELLADRAAVIARGRILDIGPLGSLGPPDARIPRVTWTNPLGEGREERTWTPGETVARLVAQEGEPRDLVVARPSVEEIYFGLLAAADAEAEVIS
jgi:ABC-2 type transport system ATP-binding protein